MTSSMESASKLTPMALCIDVATQLLWVVDYRLQALHSQGGGRGWAHHLRFQEATACPSEGAIDKHRKALSGLVLAMPVVLDLQAGDWGRI